MNDEATIDMFATAMKHKMRLSAATGRSGWQHVPEEDLWNGLHSHISKNDPVDIANYAMMIWASRSRVELSPLEHLHDCNLALQKQNDALIAQAIRMAREIDSLKHKSSWTTQFTGGANEQELGPYE